MTELDADDFAASGAEESYSEGVIDHLRVGRGHRGRGADPRADRRHNDGGRARKVSLRASDERVDVSAIARAQGGGGHRQAAGFSTVARSGTSWSRSCARKSRSSSPNQPA